MPISWFNCVDRTTAKRTVNKLSAAGASILSISDSHDGTVIWFRHDRSDEPGWDVKLLSERAD